MVNTGKKLAFTLAEALVSMLILSIFIGLSMKIFTKKHAKPVYNPTHGYYICFRGLSNNNAENIVEGQVYENVGAAAAVPRDEDYCEFTPPKSANYFVIYAVGGGGSGRGSFGGAPGEFTTLFVTNIADPLKIYPGAGGSSGGAGNATEIRNNDNTDNLILSVKGGLGGGETRIRQRFVRSCKVVPLANMLNNATNKAYLDNQNMDRASCIVTSTGLTARLCPHTKEDVRQDTQIDNFFKAYAKSADNAWGVGVKSIKGNANMDKYKYDYDSKCILQTESGASKLRYCLRNGGDKLEDRPTASDEWRYVGLKKDMTLNCLEQSLKYTDIDIDTTSDSSMVIRSAGNFKYMIDLHYDMSTINNTEYMKTSGFGKYIESSGLKPATQNVMFLNTVQWKARTAATATNQFEPSMGDSGAKPANGYNGAGMPGAVFIAW